MNALEKVLVQELRSGKRKQTVGHLRDSTGFCCLGVACDVWLQANYGRGRWSEYSQKRLPDDPPGHEAISFYINDEEDDVSLPILVEEALGWAHEEGQLDIERRPEDIHTSHIQMTLAELNDAGFTFDQIADIIEAGLVNHGEHGWAA